MIDGDLREHPRGLESPEGDPEGVLDLWAGHNRWTCCQREYKWPHENRWERRRPWLHGHPLPPVGGDHVSRDPVGAGLGQRHDRTAQVGGRREPVVRISLGGDLDQLLIAGNLAQRRRVGHATAQRVDRNAQGRKLERELLVWDSSAAFAAETAP